MNLTPDNSSKVIELFFDILFHAEGAEGQSFYNNLLRNANRLTFFLSVLCETFVFKKTVFLNTKDTKILHKEHKVE